MLAVEGRDETMGELTRREFFVTSAAACAGLSARSVIGDPGQPSARPVSRGRASRRDRPNILYLINHDHGWHFGSYGEKAPTPNLDRFAADGLRLSQSFCNSPACSPSRGCAMTGLYAHTNGLMGLANRAMGWSLPEGVRTIVDYLNDAGYETAHAGFQHERYRIEANRYQVEMARDGREYGFVENAVDQAIEYLTERRDTSRPFYLNVGTIEVHPSAWNDPVRGRNDVYGIIPEEEIEMPEFLPDWGTQRELLGKFYGCIRYWDKHVQRLLDGLEKAGLRENTLVVVASDHGINALRCKGTLYDRGVATATMLQWPGVIEPGQVSDHLMQNIDLVPTLLDAADVQKPSHLQGRSYFPLLVGETYRPHDYIFTEFNYHVGYDPTRAIRTPRYHYLRYFDEERVRFRTHEELERLIAEDPRGDWRNNWWRKAVPTDVKEELYDIQADPYALNNLAADSDYDRLRRELSATVEHWMHETADPLLQGPIPDRMNPWPEHLLQG